MDPNLVRSIRETQMLLQLGHQESSSQPGYPESSSRPGYPESQSRPEYPESQSRPGYPDRMSGLELSPHENGSNDFLYDDFYRSSPIRRHNESMNSPDSLYFRRQQGIYLGICIYNIFFCICMYINILIHIHIYIYIHLFLYVYKYHCSEE
jgi:hypothetical protein